MDNTTNSNCDEYTWEPRAPLPGEFFDPEPGSWNGPDPKIRSVGEPRVEIGRLGAREYRLLRHVGYRDPQTEQTWVVPRDLDDWTFNFSSAPTVVNWMIPVRGSHFNAFVLHDALVEDKLFQPGAVGDHGGDYFGPKVSREEADRIARDAMGEFGTGFLRRWIGWAGTMIGTITSKESLGASRRTRLYTSLLVAHLCIIAFVGGYSTGEVFGWWSNLPWMEGEAWPVRLLLGALGAFVVPVALAFIWGKRWLFGLIVGLLLAVLLPVLLVTVLLSALYLAAEWCFHKAGKARPNTPTLRPCAFGRRGVEHEVQCPSESRVA